jgi:tetratricopeptide (TPR) repeat protein
VQEAERLRKQGVTAAGTDVPLANELFDRADELLAQAEALDSAFIEPLLLRSEIALRRVRANVEHPHDAAGAARIALGHAERVLARQRNHARALELRGSSAYFLHLLRVVPDPVEQAALRHRARADLVRATQLDPRLASAYAMLSSVYAAEDESGAVVAAQRAFEADAFLENASTVLLRLWQGTWNLGSFTSAQRWCEEALRRFPTDWRFADCELRLMITPALPPDPERGWAIVARVDSVTPAADREWQSWRSELAMGGVLARAAKLEPHRATVLTDSARAVLRRALGRVDPARDHEGFMLWEAAYGYVLLGDHDEAIALLRRAILAGGHGFRADGQMSWRWRELQGHPRFHELVTTH